MDLLSTVRCVLVVAASMACCQHTIHMLQLESYQLPGYWAYVKRDRDRLMRTVVFPGLTFFVISFAVSVAGGMQPRYPYYLDWIVLSAFTLYAAWRAAADLRRPAKKALVYTKRVLRLECVLFALTCAVTALAAFTRLPVYVVFAVCPFLTAGAAYCAQPIENRVNAGFFRAAEKKLREHENIIRIGITGSYGKTSVKFALREILSVKYNVLATPASFNTPMGLSRVINEQLLPEHRVFLAEMGARHEGDIRELCGLVHPTIGVITSVGPQHLETFGSLEKIADTKYELIEGLPKDGVAFFGSGSIMIDRLYARCDREKYRAVTDGERRGYMTVKDVETGRNGNTFTLVCEDGEEARCRTRLLGRHNIENIALSACVARRLGMTMAEIAAGIRRIMPVEHRLQLLEGPTTVIDDAFNSNPEGCANALEVLSGFPGRRIIVTPGMVEQGEKEDELNYEFGSRMPGRVDVAILVGPKHTAPIRKALIAGGFDEGALYTVKDLDEATKLIASIHTDSDVILFENDLPDNYDE